MTVNVGAPGLDKTKVTNAVKSFVDSYNSVVSFVQGKLKEQRIPTAKTDSEALKGLLFGDSMLTGVLSQLRSSIADPLAGSPATLDEMSEAGISTGTTTGDAAFNPDSVTGLLTLDSAKLSAALGTDPTSVRRLLGGDGTTTGVSGRLTTLLDSAAGAGGTIDTRVDSSGRQISTIKDQLADMQRRLDMRRKALQAQFTAMETALNASQSQSAWLQGQLAGLSSSPR